MSRTIWMSWVNPDLENHLFVSTAKTKIFDFISRLQQNRIRLQNQE